MSIFHNGGEKQIFEKIMVFSLTTTRTLILSSFIGAERDKNFQFVTVVPREHVTIKTLLFLSIYLQMNL